MIGVWAGFPLASASPVDGVLGMSCEVRGGTLMGGVHRSWCKWVHHVGSVIPGVLTSSPTWRGKEYGRSAGPEALIIKQPADSM